MQNTSDDLQDNKKKGKMQGTIAITIAIIFSIFFISYLRGLIDKQMNREITYNEFITMVNEGKVESVTISDKRIIINPKKGENVIAEGLSLQVRYYTKTLKDPARTQFLIEAGVPFKGVEDNTGELLTFVIFNVLPMALIFGSVFILMRRMGGSSGIMSFGKSRAKVYEQKETGITFKDVAGQDEAQESLNEIVDFLHNPGKYTKIGAKLPKGALLVGPPGTGKTLLAKAVAGEAGVPFYSLAGSDFIEMFAGVGASRVRDLFRQAQQNTPCIMFIDEIDAIGKNRESRMGSNEEREQTLNQLLSEMDGFDSSKGLVILAATNRPESLDPALLRPGRFDRRVIVDKPDLKGRLNVLKVHSKDVLMDDSVDLEAIALSTAGAVGSDLANMINEAAINAVKNGRTVVNQEDLLESVEVVIAGKEKKDRIMNNKEKRIVAFHEVGHALAAAFQKDTTPVQKITIVPRTMGSLGYVIQTPEEEKFLVTENELRAELVIYLAGRAAEEINFDSVTTGASNDIERATNIARSMVTRYGMSPEFGLMGIESVEHRYLNGDPVINCADVTAAKVDEVVREMLKTAYDEAKELLLNHRETLNKIAEYLLEKESITGKEFMKIFNEMEPKQLISANHEKNEETV